MSFLLQFLVIVDLLAVTNAVLDICLWEKLTRSSGGLVAVSGTPVDLDHVDERTRVIKNKNLAAGVLPHFLLLFRCVPCLLSSGKTHTSAKKHLGLVQTTGWHARPSAKGIKEHHEDFQQLAYSHHLLYLQTY